jgi:SAM-dependent methyltransferase
MRAVARELKHRFPTRVECNICNWKGRRFDSDSWHPYTICWRCGSQVRHRLLMAALLSHPKVSQDKLTRAKRILHFAPESQLAGMLKNSTRQYRTANIDGSADMKLDLSNMPNIPAESFDLVVACDVLEHVSSDRAALKEIFRVLPKGGWAILTVPQKDGLADTYEDPGIVDPKERERLFGQWDHLRIYGESFPRILESEGFKPTVIDETSFPNDVVRRNVLFPPVLSPHPLATNYRKVFFAMKPN